MLTDMFNGFIGAKIIKLNEVYDYWQMFTEVAVINIFTNYYMMKGDITIDNIDFVLNKRIVAVSRIAKECLIFTLDNSIDFCISLRPDDYIGPEAYCIAFFGSDIDIVG